MRFLAQTYNHRGLVLLLFGLVLFAFVRGLSTHPITTAAVVVAIGLFLAPATVRHDVFGLMGDSGRALTSAVGWIAEAVQHEDAPAAAESPVRTGKPARAQTAQRRKRPAPRAKTELNSN